MPGESAMARARSTNIMAAKRIVDEHLIRRVILSYISMTGISSSAITPLMLPMSEESPPTLRTMFIIKFVIRLCVKNSTATPSSIMQKRTFDRMNSQSPLPPAFSSEPDLAEGFPSRTNSRLMRSSIAA